MKKKIALSKLEVASFITDSEKFNADTIKGGDEPVTTGQQTQALICYTIHRTCGVNCDPNRTRDRICFTQVVAYCGA